MRTLYTLSIRIYRLIILLASAFSSKAKKWINGRQAWENRFANQLPQDKSTVWFHCASLGEFEQGRPVIEAYRKQKPKAYIALTFFSPSGFEIRKNYDVVDLVCYLPADTPSNAKKFIHLLKPTQAYFVKYEFWFNYLNELKSNHIDTYLISGIFRDNQHFFKWYGGWFRSQLSAFTHFFLQNADSADLLQSIGLNNYTVCGDTRFDRVKELVVNSSEIPSIATFCQSKPTIVAGSTWPKDEELLLQVLDQFPETKVVIAPHEINANHINSIKELFGNRAGLYSENEFNQAVLIVDSIGLLSSIYRYADWAYIGGGFGSGIHNTLEAVSYGIPVVFGPNYSKFQEAKDLIELKAGFSIKNGHELINIAKQFKEHPKQLKVAGEAGLKYVNKRTGATPIIIENTTKTF